MIRLFVGLAALALVTGCGIKGDLTRPDPMWNAPGAIRGECRREAAHNARDPQHPVRIDRRCQPAADQTQTQTQSPISTPSPLPSSPTQTSP
jgi:predicted small lipoprotein YifL